MVEVVFVTCRGDRVEARADLGTPLLAVAQAAGMPLEGTCEGQMACSTCHVIVERGWFARLAPASEDEEDLLDLAAGVTGTSRLACQVTLEEALSGIEVRIPHVAHDMQVR